MFKTLASKSFYSTGLDFGLDKHYDTRPKIVSAVQGVYKEVSADPNRFAVSEETIGLVEQGLKSRKGFNQASILDDKEIESLDERKLVLGSKNKAWMLLNRKLDYLLKNKKAFRNESIQKLAWVAGLTFDKSQIVDGKATETISILSKVKEGITASEAMAEIMKVREANTKIDDGE